MKQITFSEKLQKQQKEQPYYLGLDIGSASVGYAVTDPEYNIIRKGKKALWGAHLFTEAESKAERRAFRTARRRREREKKRIKLLQAYFAEAIAQKDPGFFQRMKDSFFYADDKAVEQTNTLFNDEDYQDKDYHEKYPTIYHLRAELMNSSEPHDVREVYLALHHLMKNRGHFLTPNLSVDETKSAKDELLNFNETYKELFGKYLWPSDNENEVLEILTYSGETLTDKSKRLYKLMDKPSTTDKRACDMVVGRNVNTWTLFRDLLEDFEKDEATVKFSLADDYADNDELQNDLQNLLGDYKDIVDAAYTLYNTVLLQQLLRKEDGGRYNSISEAKVGIYEKHAEDLALLKTIIREFIKDPEKGRQDQAKKIYKEIFRENKKSADNYVAYSGHSDSRNKQSPVNNCSQEDFLSFIKKKLNALLKGFDDPRYDKVFSEIEAGTFMPRIRSTDNGVIPYQLNERELVKILENASSYLDFLTPQVCEEIRQIFTFRIPYYVGPMDDRSEYAWLKRRYDEPVRPWNLEDVVDIPETSKEFIRQMTNKCTYLLGEDVLPKNSLLYSEYQVRNALSNLTWDSKRLSPEVIEALYENLFLESKGGRVTKNKVVNALHDLGFPKEKSRLGGMDADIPVNLKPYLDFKYYLEEKILTEAEVEEIIEKLTIFPESRSLIIKWLDEHFSEKLSEDEIKEISKLQYKDWGRFSRKLLDGIYCVLPDGEILTIIEVMRRKPMNLMEILHDKQFAFLEKIEKENSALMRDPHTITEEFLDELALPSPVHKSLRKTLLITKEVMQIMGGAPAKVFVEMPRDSSRQRQENKGKRTNPRKNQLEELYKALKKDCRLWNDELEKIPAERFKSKKLFLYALQQGRCMYSGEEIRLEDLYDNNLYDIDHIYPRSLTKDDSFNNLVLVKKQLNTAKSDTYPLPKSVREKNRAFWSYLFKNNFISDEKYKRLTRATELTPQELEDFIARQLVETRQTTKIAAELLEQVLPESRVVYVKAGLVNDFRYRDGTRDEAKTWFYFPKVRNLNDFHHAKDAYLNVVVGNVYDSKFTKRFYKNLKMGEREYNLVKLFDTWVKGAWKPHGYGTIKTVKKMMRRNNVLITHETRREQGGLFDQMLMKKGKGQYPIKTSDERLKNFERYGAYNSVKISYFVLVKHVVKNKEKLRFIGIPVALLYEEDRKSAVDSYINSLGLKDVKVLCYEIKKGSEVIIDGIPYIIASKELNSIRSAIPYQAYYSYEFEKEYRKIESYKNWGSTSIEKVDLDAIYCNLAKRYLNEPFSQYSNLVTQGEKLIENFDNFRMLDLDTKVYVLDQMLYLLTGAAQTSDFSDVYNKPGEGSGGSSVGKITFSMNQKGDTPICVVDYSITGFYRNVRRLN